MVSYKECEVVSENQLYSMVQTSKPTIYTSAVKSSNKQCTITLILSIVNKWVSKEVALSSTSSFDVMAKNDHCKSAQMHKLTNPIIVQIC